MEIRGGVVITGASTGIGEACALHLDRLGFRVFAGVRKETDGQALKRRASPKLVTVRLDVTDPASLSAGAATVDAGTAGAGLVGLVNNAGVVVPGPLEFLPIAEFRRQLEVNVVGQLATTQAFLPLLRKGGGRIVNMGSIEGRWATPFLGAYAASKFALEGLTDSLRMELRPWRIHVAIIEPGSVATPIWGKLRVDATTLEAGLSAAAHALYTPFLQAHDRAAQRLARAGQSPAAVARAVAHALAARRPRTRYAVGRAARLGALLAGVLPDRLRDTLTARELAMTDRSRT